MQLSVSMEVILDLEREADPTHVLQGNPGQDVGVSIVMITSVAGVADLQNTTQALLGSMSYFSPQISSTNSTLSWDQVGPPPSTNPLPCLSAQPVVLASLTCQLQ